MRIISDFHDYYDIGMKYGVDNHIIYNRNEREIHKNEFEIILKNIPIDRFKSGLFMNRYPNMCYILFCGKLIPFVSFERYNYDGDFIFPFYSLEDYVNFIDKPCPQYLTEYYWDNNNHKNLKDEYYRKPSKYFTNFFSKKGIELFYGMKSQEIDNTIVDLHLLFNSPIIFIKRNKLHDFEGLVNPCLKYYKFMKIYDPFTAFQEIQMFVSTYLVEEKKVAELSDIMRLQKHGFDKKTSFRNM